MTTNRSPEPKLVTVRGGWAAVGNGWAVIAPSRDGAVAAFDAAARKHQELAGRTAPTGEALESRSI